MNHETTTSDGDNSGSRYSSPSLRRLKLLPSRFISFSQLGKELCTYKIFYFLLYSSFGTTFPFFPRYYEQIGFSNGEKLSLLAMRPLVQGITAPFWGLIVDVTWLSKKRLVQCCLLAWLIILISTAFIEPTDQVCEFRLSNRTHSLFINRTKVKAGFFKRTLQTNDLSKGVADLRRNKEITGKVHKISMASVRERLKKEKLITNLESRWTKYSAVKKYLHRTKNVTSNWMVAQKGLGGLTAPLHRDTMSRLKETKRKNNSKYDRKYLNKKLTEHSTKNSTKGVRNMFVSLFSSHSRDFLNHARERRGIMKENQTRVHIKKIKSKKRLKIQRHVNNEIKFNITSKNTLYEDSKTLSGIFNKAVWLVIVGEALLTPVLVHTDSSLLQCLGEAKSSFGHTRSFSSCGFTIFFISVSALLSHSVRLVCSQMYADFVICFCIFFVCTTATLTATTQLNLPLQNPSKNIVEKIKSQLHNSHFLTLMAAVIFLGFVHSMLGQVSLHGCVNCRSTFEDDTDLQIARGISEVLGFSLSGCMINLLGQLNVIFACIVVCNLNIFFSSFLRGTCRVVLVTIIDSGLYGVVWSVLCIYFAHIAPHDSQGSLQGLLQCFYWGVGSGLGILISGPLYAVLGLANMLRISAIIGALVCILFTLGLRSLQWQDRGYYTYLFACWSDCDNYNSKLGQSENRPLLNSGKKTSEDGEDSGEDSGIESLEHDFEKVTNEVAEQESRKLSKKLTYAPYSPSPRNTINATTMCPDHRQTTSSENKTETEHRPKIHRVYEQRSKSLPSSPLSSTYKFNCPENAVEGSEMLAQILSHKQENRHSKRKDKLSPSIPAFNQMVLHRPKMADVSSAVEGELEEYEMKQY